MECTFLSQPLHIQQYTAAAHNYKQTRTMNPPARTNAERIRNLLEVHGPLYTKRIASELNIAADDVKDALEGMEDAERCHSGKHQRWVLSGWFNNWCRRGHYRRYYDATCTLHELAAKLNLLPPESEFKHTQGPFGDEFTATCTIGANSFGPSHPMPKKSYAKKHASELALNGIRNRLDTPISKADG